LSLQKHSDVGAGSQPAQERAGYEPAPTVNNLHSLASQIVREVVIPELTTEVNEGKNFAQLRQVYNSLILATWYKKKIKDSILAQVYADRNKVAGVGYDRSLIIKSSVPSAPRVSLRPIGHLEGGTNAVSDEAILTKTTNPNKIASLPLVARNDTNGNTNDVDLIYQRYLKAFKKGVYNYIKEEQDPVTQEVMPRKYFSGGFNLMLGNEAMVTTYRDETVIGSASKGQFFTLHIILDIFRSKLGFQTPQAVLPRKLDDEAAKEISQERAWIINARALINKKYTAEAERMLNDIKDVISKFGSIPEDVRDDLKRTEIIVSDLIGEKWAMGGVFFLTDFEKKPVIVINTMEFLKMSQNKRRFTLGHELGHVLFRDVHETMMLYKKANQLPVGFYETDNMIEDRCDRIGLYVARQIAPFSGKEQMVKDLDFLDGDFGSFNEFSPHTPNGLRLEQLKLHFEEDLTEDEISDFMFNWSIPVNRRRNTQRIGVRERDYARSNPGFFQRLRALQLEWQWRMNMEMKLSFNLGDQYKTYKKLSRTTLKSANRAMIKNIPASYRNLKLFADEQRDLFAGKEGATKEENKLAWLNLTDHIRVNFIDRTGEDFLKYTKSQAADGEDLYTFNLPKDITVSETLGLIEKIEAIEIGDEEHTPVPLRDEMKLVLPEPKTQEAYVRRVRTHLEAATYFRGLRLLGLSKRNDQLIRTWTQKVEKWIRVLLFLKPRTPIGDVLQKAAERIRKAKVENATAEEKSVIEVEAIKNILKQIRKFGGWNKSKQFYELLEASPAVADETNELCCVLRSALTALYLRQLGIEVWSVQVSGHIFLLSRLSNGEYFVVEPSESKEFSYRASIPMLNHEVPQDGTIVNEIINNESGKNNLGNFLVMPWQKGVLSCFYFSLGNTLDHGKIDTYYKAIDLSPKYYSVYLNLAIELENQNKLEEAIEAYKKVIAIDSKNLNARSSLRYVLKRLEDREKATEAGSGNLAMTGQEKRGGIDLTSNQFLQTQNGPGGEIKFHIDPAMLAELQKSPGFEARVISIQPLESLPEFLGIKQEN